MDSENRRRIGEDINAPPSLGGGLRLGCELKQGAEEVVHPTSTKPGERLSVDHIRLSPGLPSSAQQGFSFHRRTWELSSEYGCHTPTSLEARAGRLPASLQGDGSQWERLQGAPALLTT